MSSLYLKLSENSGDVGLISQIGEDFQLKNTKLHNKEKPMLINCSLYSLNALLIDSRATEQENRIKNNLQDFNLCGVCGADVETLQVRFEHSLWHKWKPQWTCSSTGFWFQAAHTTNICSSPSSWWSSLPRSEEQRTGLHWGRDRLWWLMGGKEKQHSPPLLFCLSSPQLTWPETSSGCTGGAQHLCPTCQNNVPNFGQHSSVKQRKKTCIPLPVITLINVV